MNMQSSIKALKQQWGKLSQREAMIVTAGIFVAVLILWNAVVYEPYRKNATLLDQEIKQTEAQIAGANARNLAFQIEMKKDPDSENRKLLEQYIETGKRLDAELAKASVQIVNVRDMVALLKEMLAKQSSLKFVGLENRPAVPEFTQKGDQANVTAEESITIYRHSVVLKMEGSYSSLLAYLQDLEDLPWQFFWQGIEIETESYPNALITLEVYTMGLREGLVGV